ncbi:MAG: hypothetical protein GY795_32995 [Desulfobacterales bacterium]|nr:hypothetical protein [Desulfobacterales bacterium]
MSKIIGIHPADGDLRFFRKMIKKFEKVYGKNFQYYRLGFDDRSHEKCIEGLNNATNSFFMFLCHGVDKKIKGASRPPSHRKEEYDYGYLLSPSKNMQVVRGNKIFCLACLSKSLGRAAIEQGAIVYLGFDEVQFSVSPILEKRVKALSKYELRTVLFESLTYSFKNNITFNQFSNYLKLRINKRRNELMLDKKHKGRKARVEVAKTLGRIKSGITLFGDGNTKLKS